MTDHKHQSSATAKTWPAPFDIKIACECGNGTFALRKASRDIGDDNSLIKWGVVDHFAKCTSCGRETRIS
jgi:hypothetical protein